MNAPGPERRLLAALQAKGRLRSLQPIAGIDFASNDYLGLANSAILRAAAREAVDRGVPLGAGSARLLRGNHVEHEALEAEAAVFFGTARSLYLANGYTANLAIFSTLPRPGDLVLHDALIHASAHDGMRFGRAAVLDFAHNDVTHAEAQIVAWRRAGGAGRIWLACESVYSMEGDLAPLAPLQALALRHGAVLVVDEAHATGVFGVQGRGLMEAADNVLLLHTCGKALGASGALICGAAGLIELLINKARSFIFSTAPSPLMAALVRAALRELQQGAAQAELTALVARAQAAAQALGLLRSGSQILPVVLGQNARTMQVAAAMQARGFDLRGIRPPTVPVGTARLRISITRNVTIAQIDTMFAALVAELEAV
ncbi:8-amino-7-oxononanoate synthase [Cypionkella psychrotolerans]|uniref:8-amino-7-oxononanoate synthase n=1 Tax=Cypionkella psychrotolerans TaxID=1678131 RepID=UPI0006B4A5A6|nr:8-amino-7-oxononanoate synthase [Cypionkella psychrotolerans]